jgi:hypothetical protein
MDGWYDYGRGEKITASWFSSQLVCLVIMGISLLAIHRKRRLVAAPKHSAFLLCSSEFRCACACARSECSRVLFIFSGDRRRDLKATVIGNLVLPPFQNTCHSGFFKINSFVICT